MTHLTELYELISHISELSNSSDTHKQAIPPITQHACEPQQFASLLSLLLQEGQQHQRLDWAAHMTSPISHAALMGQIVNQLHNGNLLSPELYPVLADIEHSTVSWLSELFEQPYGHMTAGSSYGNLEALWQAKQASTRRTVYASTSTHYSIHKACQLLDLELVEIPCNSVQQLDIEALEIACQQQPPLAIVANAGTSAFGAFDPIEACVNIAKQYQAWCHIDAAWGGGLKLLPEYAPHFGCKLSQVDSLCFDPHKAWGQPKPSSFLFYRQPTSLIFDANYLQQPPQGQLHGSRGGEACLPLWLTLQTQGIKGLTQWCRNAITEAQSLADTLQEKTNWVVYPQQSGIVCFQCSVDLTPLIQQGILSLVQHESGPIYRCVFIGESVSSKAVTTQLQPYF